MSARILFFTSATLPKNNSSALKIGPNPEGNNHIPTMHFQNFLLLVSGRVIVLSFVDPQNKNTTKSTLHRHETDPDIWEQPPDREVTATGSEQLSRKSRKNDGDHLICFIDYRL